jgi:hypothetical protein
VAPDPNGSGAAQRVSRLRGGKYIHSVESLSDEVGTGLTEVGELAAAEVGAGVMIDD